MNYQDFRENIYDQLDDRVKLAQRKIQKEYFSAYKSIYAKIQKMYANFANISKEDYYLEYTKYNRLNSLLAEIETIIKKSNKEINTEILKTARQSVNNSYYLNQYANKWVNLYPTTIINERAVQLSVFYTDEAWNNFYNSVRTEGQRALGKAIRRKDGLTLRNIFDDNNRKSLNKVRDTITQGLIQGKSNQAMARAMKDTFDKSYSNALRVARTETHRNMMTGEYINYFDAEKQLGDRIKRQILSTRDDRTREQSLEVDNRIADEEGFLYPDGNRYPIPGNTGIPEWDINDRESVIEIIDGVQPTARRGVNPVTGEKGVFSFSEFDTWLDSKGIRRNSNGEIVKKG